MAISFKYNSTTNEQFKKLITSAASDDAGNPVSPSSQLQVLSFPEDLFSPKAFDSVTDKVSMGIGFYIMIPTSAKAVKGGSSDVYSESDTQMALGYHGLDYAKEVNKPITGQLAEDVLGKKERLRIFRQSRMLKSMIMLYMPETLNSDLTINYNQMDVGGAFTGIAATMLSAADNGIKSFLGNMSAGAGGAWKDAVNLAAAIRPEAKLLQQGMGIAINPMSEMLFENMSFRTFSFDYTFTPKSKAEASDVDNIIRMFRAYAVPEFDKDAVAGAFFSVPAFFQIKFYTVKNGTIAENTKLNKISGCVLENILVDYAPNGYAMHEDGYPVTTRIQMNFKELEVMHRDRIMEGY